MNEENIQVYSKKMKSGIKLFVIKKPDFAEKMAAVAVDFGSADRTFYDCEGKMVFLPQGVAHFIEHRLFVKKDGDFLSKFSQIGCRANAFTDCSKTVYYFSCEDNFEKGLDMLLEMVTTPYFRKKGTDEEKSIIAREIKMYDDDIDWTGYFTLLRAMYSKHSVREPIAGKVEDVYQTDKDILQKCYDAFYVPERMAVVCCGDIDEEAVEESVEKYFDQKMNKKAGKLVYDIEMCQVQNKEIIRKADISKPMFNFGFKCDIFGEKFEDIVAANIACEVLFSPQSKIFERLYSRGLVLNPMSRQFVCGRGFGFFVIGSKSENTKAAVEVIYDSLSNKNFEDYELENIKRGEKGRFLIGENSINQLLMNQCEYGLKSTGIDKICTQIEKTDKACIDDIINRCFNYNNCAVLITENY